MVSDGLTSDCPGRVQRSEPVTDQTKNQYLTEQVEEVQEYFSWTLKAK